MSRYEAAIPADVQQGIDAFLAKPFKTPLAGACCGCGRGVPLNYPYRVTRYEKSFWEATMPSHVIPVQRPADIWCKECAQTSEGAIMRHDTGGHAVSHRRRKQSGITDQETQVEDTKLTPRQIAEGLYGQLSADEGHGSKTLAKMAGIDVEQYESLLIPILQKLAAAGKCEKRDKKWWRL